MMASIKDVASKAGVSISTVSRVLNNTGYISKEARKKVEAAMKELEYEPNQVARSLQRSQSFLIGVIVPDSNHPFFSELIKYIEIYLTELDYKILICNSLDNPEKEQQYISMLRQNRVDGIIMCSHTLEVESFKNIGLPVVAFDRIISNEIPYVSSDNFHGGQIAAKHLIKQGCKHLLHLSGPLNVDLLPNRRWDGFRATCLDASIPYNVMECTYDELNYDTLNIFIQNNVMNKIHQYDGVFCNDSAAYALYINCKKVGLHVPEQLKIVGYDYHSFTRMLQRPKLTTVMQPINKIGMALSSKIVEMIEEKEKDIQETIHNNIVLGVKLIEGETT